MADAQAEPFHVALGVLRSRLQLGLLAPGGRITAVDLADELRLSTTPVREALARLAGEGLVEDRRGQGYFVRLLGAADIADLHRMSLASLLIALDPRRLARAEAAGAEEAPGAADPVAAVESLFQGWVGRTGSRALVSAFRGLQIQLGPVRRLEARVVPDLQTEAARLLALAGDDAPRGERLVQLRQFHGRRLRDSERLAALVEAAANAARK